VVTIRPTHAPRPRGRPSSWRPGPATAPAARDSSPGARYSQSVDQGRKRRAYHGAGVEHYWLIDPTNGTLTVLERAERDYLIVLVAGSEEVVAEIFGDDEAGEEADQG
jgi:hypothetical protein